MEIVSWKYQDDAQLAADRLKDHLRGTVEHGPICKWALEIIDSPRAIFGSVRTGTECDWHRVVNEAFTKYLSLRKSRNLPVSVSVLLPTHWGISDGEIEASAWRVDILRSGAMIGVLGPACKLRSVKRQDTQFRPFQSPDNWLNIRSAVLEDTAFLDVNPELRSILLETLLFSRIPC